MGRGRGDARLLAIPSLRSLQIRLVAPKRLSKRKVFFYKINVMEQKGGDYLSSLIRMATIDDVVQVSNLYVTSMKNTFHGIFSDGYLSKLTPETSYQQWRKNIENPNNIVLILEDNREIVGMIVGSFVDQEGETSNQGNILAVYIKPDYKRNGYGKKLVEALFEEFKKRNITKCVAKVFKNNDNKGFFEEVGGMLVEERPLDEAHAISIFVYSWSEI